MTPCLFEVAGEKLWSVYICEAMFYVMFRLVWCKYRVQMNLAPLFNFQSKFSPSRSRFGCEASSEHNSKVKCCWSVRTTPTLTLPSFLDTHINTEVRNQGVLWKLQIPQLSPEQRNLPGMQSLSLVHKVKPSNSDLPLHPSNTFWFLNEMPHRFNMCGNWLKCL